MEVIPKIGRPNERQRIENISTENQSQSRILRSSGILYNRDLCAICQKDGGLLRNASLEQTGKNMLQVAKDLSDKSFFIRLNSIPKADDAVASDIKYHLKC